MDLENIQKCNSEGRNEGISITNRGEFYKEYDIRLLHHNVQSLNNKILDIVIMLATENINADILCFTEHWLPEVQMNVLNTDDFKLASNFSRKHIKAG